MCLYIYIYVSVCVRKCMRILTFYVTRNMVFLHLANGYMARRYNLSPFVHNVIFKQSILIIKCIILNK